MRSIFLILSLLLTLSVVGVLVKKQLASAPAGVASTPGAAPTLQSPQPPYVRLVVASFFQGG